MNWLTRFLFQQKRLVKPAPVPTPRPYTHYRIEGAVRYAVVYLVLDRANRERSRHVGYLN